MSDDIRDIIWSAQYAAEHGIIGHHTPYRKIDITHPGRRMTISYDEWMAMDPIREPDAEIYEKAWDAKLYPYWTLKAKYL